MSDTTPAPPAEQPTAPISSGCGKGCASVFVAILLLTLAVMTWSSFQPDPEPDDPPYRGSGSLNSTRAPVRQESGETIKMLGTVTLSPAVVRQTVGRDCAGDHPLHVMIVSSADTIINLTGGIRTNDGFCVYGFILNVPEMQSYRFELAGFDAVNVQRSMVDTVGESGETVLEVRLSW